MKTLLSGLGTAALGFSVLLTLLLALTTKLYTLRPPSGPDAMGLVVVFFLPVVAWVLVLAGALCGVWLGGFDWVSRSPGVPTLVVLGTVVGLGGLSVAAAMFSLEVRYSSRTAVGLLGGLVLPLGVIGLLGFLLRAEPTALAASRWLRHAGVALGGLAAAAWLGGFVLLAASSVKKARAVEAEHEAHVDWETRNRQEMASLHEKQAAELAALPDDAPIEAFLTHLFIDKSAEHHGKAIARIRALSDLTARLAARLEHPEPLEREHVLNFVAMAGAPDPAWEPLVRAAILRLAADYRSEAEDLSIGRITHVKGLSWGALLAAERFGPKRFEEEARELRAAVALWPNEEPRNDALAVIDLYLAGAPLPKE
ncbi:MAG: hypothetical protein ACYDBY_06630 [Thermoanaerobaculia bacterium]